MTQNSASRPHVITLVHGTAATGAPWTQCGSALRKYLKAHLEDPDIRRFDWSGSNSPKARRTDAAKLAVQLTEQLDKRKDATHVIVCHSHGGDVSLRAAADPRVDGRIAGIVCLATPFIVARKRDLGKGPAWFLAGAGVAAFIGAILWTMHLLRAQHPVLRIAFAVAVGALVAGASAAIVLKWQKWAAGLERDLALPTFAPDKLLIIRAPSDEASALLAAGQLFSQVSVLVMLWTRRVFDWAERHVKPWAKRKGALIAAFATSMAFVVAMVLTYAELLPRAYPDWLLWVPIAAGGAFFVVALLSLFLLVPVLGVDGVTVFVQLAAGVIVWPIVLLMSVALVLPFGFEVAAANILLDVAGEPTPENSSGEPWHVHLVRPQTTDETGSEQASLMHSRIYDNPRVHELIVKWLQQRTERT